MFHKTLDGSQTIYFVLIFSIIMKGVLLAFFPLFDFPDGRSYLSTAQLIVENGYLWPTEINHEAPLGFYYYSLLYPAYDLLGGRWYLLGNVLMATLTIYWVYKIALEVFGQLVANVAALIMLLYPYFNFYAIHPLLETPFNLVLYVGFYFAIRFMKSFDPKYLYGFSFFFALTILMKFSGLPMYPIILMLMLYFYQGRFGNMNAVKIGVKAIVVFVLVMSPWWVRNYHVHGGFVATSIGESGKVLYTGNNPMNKSGGGITGIDVDFSAFEHLSSLEEKDQAMHDAAIKWIRENPTDWLILEARKLIRFYSPVVFTEYFNAWYYQALSLLTYGVVFALFLVSLFYEKEKKVLVSPLLLYMLLLTGIHLVFIASLRYRFPLEPFMIIMASGVLVKLLRRGKNANG